jgi:predicted ArsR family transcriptional regulator
MKPTRQQAIRECLRQHHYGLTRQQLSDKLGIHLANVRTAILGMPDVYVDRWTMGKRGSYQKVYCAVDVPEDCPHPKDRVYPIPKPATVWRQLQA